MNVIQGRNVLLEVLDGSDYTPFICTQDVAIAIRNNLINITGPSTGIWNSYKIKDIDWEVTLGGLITILGAGWNAFRTVAVNNMFNGYLVRLTFTDDDDNDGVFIGMLVLSSADMTGPQSGFSKFSNNFKGSGPYDLRINGVSVGGLMRLSAPGLTATPISTSQIDLSWSNVLNELSYQLEVSTDNTNWTALATPAANTTTYSHTGIPIGAQRYYRIKAVANGTTNIDSNWSFANARTGIGILVQLDKPNFFADTIGSTSILLSWTNVDNESNYQLQRSLNGSTWIDVASPAADDMDYTDTGLTPSTHYFYRLRAVGDGVIYDNSDWDYADATTTGVLLIQLTTPSLSASAVSSTVIGLGWTNVANEVNYVLQRSPAGTNSWSTINSPAANSTAYNDTGLAPSTTYDYRIKAVGDGTTHSDSDWSTASATTNAAAPTTFLAEWGWDADPLYGAISGGTNPLAIGSASFPNGSAITADTRTMDADHYLWVRYPNTESSKTTFYNTVFINGSIPGFEFFNVLTSGGYKYIIARNPLSFDSSSQTIFS